MFQHLLVTKLLTVEDYIYLFALFSRKEAFMCSSHFINRKSNISFTLSLFFLSQQIRANPKSKECFVGTVHFQHPTAQRAVATNSLNAKMLRTEKTRKPKAITERTTPPWYLNLKNILHAYYTRIASNDMIPGMLSMFNISFHRGNNHIRFLGL